MENDSTERTAREALQAANDKLVAINKELSQRNDELKQAFEALTKSEQRFRLLVASVKDYAIYMLDPQGIIATWNEGAMRNKGYTAFEIIGQHFSKFYTQQDREAGKPEMELREASRLGRFEDEGWRIRKDGSRFWANVVITSVRDHEGKLLGYAKVTRDLTERKNLEEARIRIESKNAEISAASRERDRLYLLFAQAPTPITVVSGPDHLIELYNPAAKNLLQVQDPTGKKIRDLTPQIFSKEELELFDRVFQTGEPEVLFSKHFPQNDRYFNIVYQPWKNNEGQVSGILSMSLEVTEQIKSMHSRDEFLSIASHELKTPITSLALQIQMTRRKINAKEGVVPSLEKLERVFDLSDKQVRRLTSLVDDLLDTSRIESGRLSYSFERINLSELVKDMAGRYMPELEKAKCPVNVSIQEDVYVTGDTLRLEQVIDNLLSNEVKYAEHSPVALSLIEDKQGVHLTLEDKGPGIPKNRQHKVFERYERAVDANNVSGLGLGLFIVREIVKAHRGDISLESAPGQGSRFKIKLPPGPQAESLH